MKRGLAPGTSGRLDRRPSIDVPLAAAVTAMPAVLLASCLPSSLLLPAIAAFGLVAALFWAGLGWMTGAARDAAVVTIWDYAGACVLIGIAAGAFSETAHVSQILGFAPAPP